MAIRKYGAGDGEVLPEDGDSQEPDAGPNWTPGDDEELREELDD